MAVYDHRDRDHFRDDARGEMGFANYWLPLGITALILFSLVLWVAAATNGG